MPWFPQDFATATAHWARAERSAYRTLLDYQWMLGGLPTDHARLAKLCDMTEAELDEIWPVVLEKFVVIGGQLKNKRLEEHRKEALRRKESHAKGAQLANAKRALSAQSAPRSADSQRTPLSPSLSPSYEEKKSSLREPKESQPRASRLPEDFALTDARRNVAESEHVDPDRTFVRFADHWRASSGANARKHDWDAAWRNWCRKEADQHPGLNGSAVPAQAVRKTRYQLSVEAAERAAAED